MSRVVGFLLLLAFVGCAPATSPTAPQVTVGKINSFEVTVISSTENSAVVSVDFSISVPKDKKYEANITIKAPGIPDPFFIALSDKFSEIAQLKMTGWKDNSLFGQILMKDGSIISGNPSKIPNLFSPPQTTYNFELFIRPVVGDGIATAIERRMITIK